MFVSHTHRTPRQFPTDVLPVRHDRSQDAGVCVAHSRDHTRYYNVMYSPRDHGYGGWFLAQRPAARCDGYYRDCTQARVKNSDDGDVGFAALSEDENSTLGRSEPRASCSRRRRRRIGRRDTIGVRDDGYDRLYTVVAAAVVRCRRVAAACAGDVRAKRSSASSREYTRKLPQD